jgi:hypothetical protein
MGRAECVTMPKNIHSIRWKIKFWLVVIVCAFGDPDEEEVQMLLDELME